MPLSKNRATYGDCVDLYTRAAASSKGIRVFCSTYGEAVQKRMRLHQLRALEREDYQSESSEYDVFKVSIAEDGDGFWVYIMKRTAADEIVEEL